MIKKLKEKLKAELKECLPICILGALGVAYVFGGEYYITNRGVNIHEKYGVLSQVSPKQVDEVFREEQKKIGLEDIFIDLKLEEYNGISRGTTEKINDSTYQVTLREPFNKITIRHELKHVHDIKTGKLKVPHNPFGISARMAEIRAQNYSIK